MKQMFELYFMVGTLLVELVAPTSAQSEWTGSLCNVNKNACITHCAKPASESDAQCVQQCGIAEQACGALAQSELRWHQSMKRCLSLPLDRQSYKADIAVAWRKKETALQAELLILRHFRDRVQTLDSRASDEKSRLRELSRELGFVERITSDLIVDLGGLSLGNHKDTTDLFNRIATGTSAYQVLSDAASGAILTALGNQGGRDAVIRTAVLVNQAADELKTFSGSDSDVPRRTDDILNKMDTLVAQILNFQATIRKIQRDDEAEELDSMFRPVQIARDLCSRSSTFP
jgi:hypothetical protein